MKYAMRAARGPTNPATLLAFRDARDRDIYLSNDLQAQAVTRQSVRQHLNTFKAIGSDSFAFGVPYWWLKIPSEGNPASSSVGS